MSMLVWPSATTAMLMASVALAQPSASVASPPSPAATAASPQAPAPNLSTPASGQIAITDPQAIACEVAAKRGDFNGAGVEQCTLALASAAQANLPALYTNRGAVYLQHRQYAQAKSDLDAALKIDPTTADAYVNRGAALLGLKQYADAIVDIDHGLSLGPDQPEKAYFNRAIADEHLFDLRAAYQDYLKASQLKPDWEPPKAELARFSP